jgi:hypothetical protein
MTSDDLHYDMQPSREAARGTYKPLAFEPKAVADEAARRLRRRSLSASR